MLSSDVIVIIAKYYVRNKSTIRETAKKFQMSKSSVHKYLSKNLQSVSSRWYRKYKKVANKNYSERYERAAKASHGKKS